MHEIILHGFSIAKCMHVRPITRYAVFLLTLSSLIYDGHAVENSKLELGANANESIKQVVSNLETIGRGNPTNEELKGS